MKRSRPLVLLVVAFLLVACGGTYHPPTGDRAIVSVGPGSQQPGTVGTIPTGGTSSVGPTTGPVVSGPSGPKAPTTQAGSKVAVSGGIIKLGGVYPLTGPIAPIGRSYYEGIASYYSYINERGGINGARIRYLVEDDQFDPARGKALIRKLITEDKVFAISGVLSPFTMVAAFDDLRQSGTPAVPGTGTDGREFNEKLIYNSYAPCERQTQGQAQDGVQRLGKTRWAFLTINLDTARDCADAAIRALRAVGGTQTYRGELQAAGPNCGPQIQNARTRNGGADAVFLLTDNLGVAKCVQAMDQQNWHPLVSVTANLVDDQAVIEALEKYRPGLSEGIHSTSPYTGINSPQYEGLCGPPMRRFFPNANTQYFTIVGCTGAHMFVTAMRALGANATQARLVDYLESGVKISTGGLSPDLSFKPNSHPGYLHMPMDAVRALAVQERKWVVVGPLFHGIHA